MIKKIALIALISVTYFQSSTAQTITQISGPDCNGKGHDLYQELDAGKAVILHFFMPNCGSCIPPAKAIQKMANVLLSKYPGQITGYAMPFNNSTTCIYSSSWVANNGLTFYTPYDSGAAQLAKYGSFGMPTIVVLGGKASNRRVMFFTASFATGDTLKMRDSIVALLKSADNKTASAQNRLAIYPNPSTDKLTIELGEKSNPTQFLEVRNLMGTIVKKLEMDNSSLIFAIDTREFPVGTYTITLHEMGAVSSKRFTVIR
jgi:thiol-disulfide isomerase/thioredoxin